MGLYDRLGVSGGSTAEEEDRGVVGRRSVGVGFRVHRRESAREIRALHRDERRLRARGTLRFFERGPHLGVDQSRRRAGVLEEVSDLLRLELRIDHDDDPAHAQDAEERADVVFPIGQRDDHAVAHFHARLDEQVGVLSGECVDVPVRKGASVGQECSALAHALHDAITQEVVE